MVTLTTGPVTLEELNEQVRHANEVSYHRNAAQAEAWIEKAQALETRNGRAETRFSVSKIGRQTVVFVDRSRN